MASKKITGIYKERQAEVVYEPNVCHMYTINLSIGCPLNCKYCLFTPLEKNLYSLINSGYKGEVIPLKIDRLLERTEFPPLIMLSYSSDPLGNELIRNSTKEVLKKLFEQNVKVYLLSKGKFTDEIIEVISARPELIFVQVGLSSSNDERNKLMEPGAPCYKERLNYLKKLNSINGLAYLAVRLDPIIPRMDKMKDIEKLLDDIREIGIKEVIISYLQFNQILLDAWKKDESTAEIASALTEKAHPVSEQVVYALPLEERINIYKYLENRCKNKGLKLAVCGCKDQRLKNTSLEWVCHPFRRNNNDPYKDYCRKDND